MFSLRYRDDPGLAFLQCCSHADLKDLAEILMTTKKGGKRRSGQLSADSRFLGSSEDLTKVWKNIAAELQRFGGDTIMNFFRGGRGVPYRKILKDVCDHLKVENCGGEDFTIVENRVLIKVLKEALEKMSEEERVKFAKSASGLFTDGKFDPARATPAEILFALEASSAMGGTAAVNVAEIAAYAVSMFLLKRGLFLSMGGPVSIAVFSAPMFSGPAYRVTTPAVIYVSYLRQKHLNVDPL